MGAPSKPILDRINGMYRMGISRPANSSLGQDHADLTDRTPSSKEPSALHPVDPVNPVKNSG
jgi:hypothetical protein